jgi:hypothetical protein
MMRRNLFLLTTLLLVASVACGGGSGDVAAGPGGGSNLVVASFVADEPNPGADTVSIAESNASGNIVTLQVNVTDTNDIQSASFDVIFDDSLVEYVGHNEGSLLEQGGNAPIYAVTPSAGRIVVGVSRQGSTGTNAVGSRVLMNLNFRAIAVGQSSLSVVNSVLRDGNNSSIPGVGWFGGSVVGN